MHKLFRPTLGTGTAPKNGVCRPLTQAALIHMTVYCIPYMVYTSVWFLFASAFCCCHLLIGNLWQVSVVNQGKCICQLTVSEPVPECYISCTPRFPPLFLPLFCFFLQFATALPRLIWVGFVVKGLVAKPLPFVI